jgi:hypothetical protein
MKITVFWDEMACGLVDIYHHFRGTLNLHHQYRRIVCIHSFIVPSTNLSSNIKVDTTTCNTIQYNNQTYVMQV